MKKIIPFLLLCFCIHAYASPLTLREKFFESKEGDFVVNMQEENYSVLSIRSVEEKSILLEEISVPTHLIDLKKIHWKKWAAENAPGHTSWILYEIDKFSGALIECFSPSKNGWVYLDPSEQFLTRLLTLPLSSVPLKERKKIGPQPFDDEEDHRPLWNPPLVMHGKKMDKPLFEVLKTEWPQDDSRLSLCKIEFYFSKDHPAFPFPYWLEVQSPHYRYKIRTIDSGNGLVSSFRGKMPHRMPLILGPVQKGKENWKLSVKIPLYFQKVHLFAIDVTERKKTTIPLNFSLKPGVRNEEKILEIPLSNLKLLLQNNHKYQWLLIPEANSSSAVESEEIFHWKIP